MQPSPWLDVTANLLGRHRDRRAFGVAMYLLRKEHKREEHHDEEARRSQAVKVSAWIEARPLPHGGRELPSTSTTPPTCTSTKSPCPRPSPPGTIKPTRTSSSDWSHLGRRCTPRPQTLAGSYFSPEPVEIEFLDSSGQHWTRDEQGFLTRRDNRPHTPNP